MTIPRLGSWPPTLPATATNPALLITWVRTIMRNCRKQEIVTDFGNKNFCRNRLQPPLGPDSGGRSGFNISRSSKKATFTGASRVSGRMAPRRYVRPACCAGAATGHVSTANGEPVRLVTRPPKGVQRFADGIVLTANVRASRIISAPCLRGEREHEFVLDVRAIKYTEEMAAVVAARMRADIAAYPSR